MNYTCNSVRILRKGFMRLARGRVVLLTFALSAVLLAVKTPVTKSGGGTFPGANGKIAFMSDRDGDSEIYTINPDGTGLTQLTSNSADDRLPAFSPDGTEIAFASTRDGNWEIYVMNADGSAQTRLTNNPAEEQGPGWSSDGSKIAFYSSRDGNAEIYVMNADGSNPTNLTNNPAGDYGPVWSPDGTKIVFQSTRDDPSFEIYTMNADGTGQTRLTTEVFTQDVQPAWSPDGTRIIWRKDPGGFSSADLWVMNFDGSSQARLLDGPGFDAECVYSPDGTQIAFTSYRDGNSEIYVMNADTSGQARLTFDGGQDSDVAWQPVFGPPNCVTPLTGLVSWWPGDGNANDIQGSNDGTLQNGATFSPGQVGQAFSFDGFDDHVSVPDDGSLRLSQLTLSAWINPTDVTANGGIITKAQASGNWVSYMIRLLDNGRVNFVVENRAESRYGHWLTLSHVSNNTWFHVAATWQNLNGDSTDARIYINGIEQPVEMSSNQGYGPTFTPGYTAEPLLIGKQEPDAPGLPGGHFGGFVDEAQVYDRVLSPSEIRAIFTAGSAGMCKNNAPVAICQDVSVTADADGTANASIDNGSFDPDGDSITTTQSPLGPYVIGQTTVTLTVEDSLGASTSCQSTVTVLYNFSGFFQPVENLPTVNLVTAGSGVPVKFRLNGDQGLSILAAGYPASQQIACSDGAPISTVEETVTAGNSSLSYDATTGQYIYVWKTAKAWKGTCRQLIVRLKDTSTHVANFQFK